LHNPLRQRILFYVNAIGHFDISKQFRFCHYYHQLQLLFARITRFL
jgi:hypothetical protein